MTVVHIAVLVLSLAGFMGLALAMPRHGKQVWNAALSDSRRRLLRTGGWLLLAIALALGIAQWRFDVGTVTWLGWLTLAGIGLVLWLSQPRRADASASKVQRRQRDKGEMAARLLGTTPGRPTPGRIALATTVLLLPMAGFAWQLLATPEKPLMRDDAIQSQIGPWSFTLAEKDHKPPEIAALDVPLKQFVIRFCEGCDADIRMAYLKVRKPRSLRAAGHAFEGRGSEKTAEIPLPLASTLEDGLWLTVESNSGDVYHQQFDIQQLSPALAGFIRGRL